MTTLEYYKHLRKLGAFKAADCLAMAREAAALDQAAEIKKARSFIDVGAEYAYGTWRRFSRQIRVF
jgi:hypothetical protein